MAVVQSLYAKTIGAYSDSSGGPIRVRVTHAGTPIEDRVADQVYPSFLAVADKYLEVEAELRDESVIKALALGAAAADVAIVLAGKADVTITASTMILYSAEASQNRAAPGSVTLRWRHQSASQAVPVA